MKSSLYYLLAIKRNYRISSGQQFGHFCFVQNILGMSMARVYLVMEVMSSGNAYSSFYDLQKDIRADCVESLKCLRMIGNANLYIHNRRTGDESL